MSSKEFAELTGREDKYDDTEGYLVEYDSPTDEFKSIGFNNYISWSPKEVFEEAYSKSGVSINSLKDSITRIESILASGGNPRVTPEDVEKIIAREEYYVVPGTTTTICSLVLKNDYVVIGSSSSVSKEAFDEELGKKYSKKKAVEQCLAAEAYLLKSMI